MHAIVEGVGNVEVEIGFVLPVDAGPERCRRVVTDRRIDRIENELIDLAGAGADARVPGEAAAGKPAEAADQRVVDQIPAKLRRESSRKPAVEGEAVRVGLDRRQRSRVGGVVDGPE